MPKQTSANAAVHNECFGADSDLEADAEAESFWQQFPTGKTTEAVHKLYASWEAQGCDGAMSNAGLSPYEVAQWESIKSHLDAEYRKSFEAAAAEIWSRNDASGWMTFWKSELQAGAGKNFVEALESLKPLQTGQPVDSD